MNSLQTLRLELTAGLGERCVALRRGQAGRPPAQYRDRRLYAVPDRFPDPLRAGDRICGHAALTAIPGDYRHALQQSYTGRYPPLELVVATRRVVPPDRIYLALVAYGLVVFLLLLWAQRRPDQAAPRLAWEVPNEGGYRGAAAEWRSCAIPEAPDPVDGDVPTLERLEPSLAGVGHRVHEAPGGRVEFVPDGRVVVVRPEPYPPLLYVSAVTVEPGIELVDEHERRFLIVDAAGAKRLESGDAPPAAERGLIARARSAGLQGELELARPLGRWRALPVTGSVLFAIAVAALPMLPYAHARADAYERVSPHLWGWAGFGGALALSVLLTAGATWLVRYWARRGS